MAKKCVYSIVVIGLLVFTVACGHWIQFTGIFIKGLIARDLCRYDQSYELFSKLKSLQNPRINVDPMLDEAILVQALRAMEKKDYGTAVQWFNRKQGESSPVMDAYKAVAFLGAGMEEKAVATVSEYLGNKSGNFEILVVWADYQRHKTGAQRTGTMYKEIKTRFPNNPWVEIYFGDIYWVAGINDKARMHYEKAMEIPNTRYVALLRMGDWIMRNTGDIAKAKAFYMESINTRGGFFCYDAYYKLSTLAGESPHKEPNPYHRRAESLHNTLSRYTVKWLKTEALTNFRRAYVLNEPAGTDAELDAYSAQ